MRCEDDSSTGGVDETVRIVHGQRKVAEMRFVSIGGLGRDAGAERQRLH